MRKKIECPTIKLWVTIPVCQVLSTANYFRTKSYPKDKIIDKINEQNSKDILAVLKEYERLKKVEGERWD